MRVSFPVGSELLYAPSGPGQDPRHGDTLEPLWNLFDLTPEGRGTYWYPELSYTQPRGNEQPLLRRPSGRRFTTVGVGADHRQAKVAVEQPAGDSGGRPGSPPQLRRPLQ